MVTLAQNELLLDSISKENKALKELDEKGLEFRKQSRRLILIVFALLLILLIINLYTMFQLHKHLNLIVQEIDHMQLRFAEVATSMEYVTGDMEKISLSVNAMPGVDVAMRSIATDMPAVAGDMGAISKDMGEVDQSLNQINYSMYELNRQMYNMSLSTRQIQNNMYEIREPTRLFDFMLP